MQKHEVTSISPSIVDVACDLTSREDVYLELCKILGSEPGDWTSVDDAKAISELLGLVAGIVNFSIENDFDSLGQANGVNIEAGSSGLNLLSALVRPQRENSAIVSAVGTDQTGQPDNLARFFGQDAGKIGIYQYGIPQVGSTPIVLVFSHREEPDKVTAMHPGVASQIEKLPEGIEKSRIVHIDAYDLLREPASSVLFKLIASNQVPIALGLGNTSILNGQFREKLLAHIKSGNITYIMGNVEEFAVLLGIDEKQISTIEGAVKAGIGNIAPYILMTMGSNGLIGFENSKPVFQKPFTQPKLINTSGAGDIAAGVFLSGILSGQKFSLTLKESAYFSSKIVGSLSSRFKTGRERLYTSNHADSGDIEE